MNSWDSTHHSCLIPQGTKERCFQDDWLKWEVWPVGGKTVQQSSSSVPLIWSEFVSTHATKRGQGCGGNNNYSCISWFINMPLNDCGYEMAFPFVGLSLCHCQNNLRAECNPRMWLSALSGAQPTEMVIHSSAWRTPVSVWDCKTVSWSSRWNFSEGFSRVILIMFFSSFGV